MQLTVDELVDFAEELSKDYPVIRNFSVGASNVPTNYFTFELFGTGTSVFPIFVRKLKLPSDDIDNSCDYLYSRVEVALKYLANDIMEDMSTVTYCGAEYCYDSTGEVISVQCSSCMGHGTIPIDTDITPYEKDLLVLWLIGSKVGCRHDR